MKKSWFALQAAKATAEGAELLGRQTRQGRALGLFLEDNDRRMAQRLAFLGAALEALQTLTRQHPDLCVMILHHTRKGRGDSPGESVSGTHGSAAADKRSVSRSAACQALAALEKRGYLGSNRGEYFIVG
jgi:RecA-family ATPase